MLYLGMNKRTVQQSKKKKEKKTLSAKKKYPKKIPATKRHKQIGHRKGLSRNEVYDEAESRVLTSSYLFIFF